jgi:hypothetical protein
MTWGHRCAENQWLQLVGVPTFVPGGLSHLETHCVPCVACGLPDSAESALSVVFPFV